MDLTFVALFFAAVAGGALNAVAGGGSFFTFPALVLAGVPTVPANATSAVALWPGSVASAFGFREDLKHSRRELVLFGALSVAGGLAGALLLLFTPEQRFRALVPWLLLGATLVFAVGPALTKRLREKRIEAPFALVLVLQLGIAVYGGYFGGGMGILMLAAFSALGMQDLHAMNGLKAILGTGINAVAIVAFVAAGIVVWPFAVAMLGGGALGGYAGARLSRRVDVKALRIVVIIVGATLAAYFFLA